MSSSRRRYRPDPGFLTQRGEEECGENGSRAEPRDSPQPSELEAVFFRGGVAVPNSRVSYQSRSSSGYFSLDSEPSSPRVSHSASTQTPSPASQVITHALRRISEARGDAHDHELWSALLNHHPPHGEASARDMPAERYVGRELRRIGDEFNQLYFHEAERNGGAAPRRAVVLWMGLLIGRLLRFFMRRR